MAERNYRCKDIVLLEWGDTIIEYLKEDIEQFGNFDAKLNATFLSELEGKINNAYKDGGDVINLTQLQQKTELVEKAMEACHVHFRKLKYWVLDAFPDKKAIQKQFGVGRYKEIRYSQTRMIHYMEGLTDTIDQHRQALTDAGAPTTLLEEPVQLAQELRKANKNQEQKKGTRTVDTEQRIEMLNEIYAILQKINAAADNVFDNSNARRELYRAPKVTGIDSSTDEEKEEDGHVF
ncbi:hypothetical protein [Aquimarina sediminis]|uniref:hypothetical protein n=1 Tax=Aquimarina sediminis TaxID=2070536 RepID=UPI000CA02EB5|nr:hypothetical protein [Aquimarina sediminis]